MHFIKISGVLLCLAVLSGCQTIGYETLAPGVRTATTYEDDTKTKVIGTRTEMEVQQLGWFEAEKTTDGTYKLTTKGKSDWSTAERNAAGDNDSGGGGGGGTCN